MDEVRCLCRLNQCEIGLRFPAERQLYDATQKNSYPLVMDFNDFLVIFRGIENTKTGIFMGNTIWLSNIAMDNYPFIDAKNDDLPIKEW